MLNDINTLKIERMLPPAILIPISEFVAATKLKNPTFIVGDANVALNLHSTSQNNPSIAAVIY